MPTRPNSGLVRNPRNIGTAVIRPEHVSNRNYKYTYTNFSSDGLYFKGDGYTAPSGTNTDINRAFLPCEIGGMLPVEYYVKGTQTIVAPVFAAGGLQVSGDLTDNEGFEYVFGASANIARGRHVFTVGDKAFFGKLTWKVADVSGTDECLFAFRKQAAYAALFAYTDFLAVGLVAALGDIAIKSNLNNAGAITTDTTANWADGETHTVEIWVFVDGSTRIYLDGARPAVSQSFTFDAGDVIEPVFDILHATTTPGLVTWSHFSCGYLPESNL